MMSFEEAMELSDIEEYEKFKKAYGGVEIIELLCKDLDNLVPGWAEKINLSTLRMVNPKLCIMGQLFPDSDSFYLSLKILGFLKYPWDDAPWANFDSLWKDEIRFRLP